MIKNALKIAILTTTLSFITACLENTCKYPYNLKQPETRTYVLHFCWMHAVLLSTCS